MHLMTTQTADVQANRPGDPTPHPGNGSVRPDLPRSCSLHLDSFRRWSGLPLTEVRREATLDSGVFL